MRGEPETMTDDLRAAFAQLEASPGDLAGYGAVADMLEELGDTFLPHAYRWMMHRQKFPHKRTHYVGDLHHRKVPARFRWAWYASPAAPSDRAEVPRVVPGSRLVLHSLPSIVMTGDQRVYPSHAAAVADLAAWLHLLKSAYDLDPPPRPV